MDDTEKEYLEKTEAGNLYIRFFDIDNEGKIPLPKAKIKPFDGTEISLTYIPVIFITNRTFSSVSDDDLKMLAEKTVSLIDEIILFNDLPEYEEIQIDCDWTENTKNVYFRFLKLLEEKSGKEITCTLRLHQIKYREKSGIPPVKKGYLMCYATSDPKGETDQNSILDISLLKEYTKNISFYPLAYDIALPLYGWGVVTNHTGEIKLINGLTEKELNPEDFEKVSTHTYKARKDLFLRGMYLNKGFTIRIEKVSPSLLKEAKEYLNKKIKKDYRIVYYHLDKKFLEQFTIEELK
ncbi:MAG: hypothetical protein LUG18_03320 [Candidatus Azobacteroides sp.]|nr:hypothetical protein [Candidatus Azobacteroides sp.]